MNLNQYPTRDDTEYILSNPPFKDELLARIKSTARKSFENIKIAIDLWLETATEFGDPIPEPKGRKLLYA